MDTNKVSRLEVINEKGRVFVIYDIKNVNLSLQDDGQTIKIFCNSMENTRLSSDFYTNEFYKSIKDILESEIRNSEKRKLGT